MMRLTYAYRDLEKTFESDATSIVIGRPTPGVRIDLDLTPDNTVSREHARISLEGGSYWVEDLNSSRGTIVDGVDIRAKGKTRLRGSDTIRIGGTHLHLQIEDMTRAVTFTAGAPGDIVQSIAAHSPVEMRGAAASRLFEVPLALGNAGSVEEAASIVVKTIAEALPGARTALLLLQANGELVLGSHAPDDAEPSISLGSAREAIDRRAAFIWVRGDAPLTISQREHALVSGIYAPLLWQQHAVGVISLSRTDGPPFSEEDLRLVAAIAHYAAMAITNQQLQTELRRNGIIMERLLTNFSPQVRARLMEKARHGRLRLGGEKSEVTVLFCDLRGFTRTSATMDAEDVVEMLNDYFSVLVRSIFACDGTIDKFIGDAILAVFGSPEPDPAQHEKAVRASVAMRDSVETLNQRRSSDGEAVCQVGIGIHCGEVLHGFVGTDDRMEYTVIGDAVNRASRYCAGAGAGEIMISRDLYGRVFRLIEGERTSIATKHEGELPAYRVQRLKRMGDS